MKFFSEPHMHITDFRTKQAICKFNAKGEFETEDETLINRLKQHFRYEEATVKADTQPKRGKKAVK